MGRYFSVYSEAFISHDNIFCGFTLLTWQYSYYSNSCSPSTLWLNLDLILGSIASFLHGSLFWWATVGVRKKFLFRLRVMIVLQRECLLSILHNHSTLRLLIQQLSPSWVSGWTCRHLSLVRSKLQTRAKGQHMLRPANKAINKSAKPLQGCASSKSGFVGGVSAAIDCTSAVSPVLKALDTKQRPVGREIQGLKHNPVRAA